MNFIDKTIGFFSPSAGFKRVQDRARMLSMQGQVRRYEGAEEGRRNTGWSSRNNSSVNEEVNRDLKNLVSRSRELSTNNPYARKAPYTIANNVVGVGIIPVPIVVSKGKKAATENNQSQVQELVKAAWISWGESLECDYDGDSNFYAIQWLAMKTIVVSGEVLLIRKRVSSTVSKIGIQIKVIEGDFIDTNKYSYLDDDGGYTLYGVKFGKNGKRSGYWLFDRHPTDYNAVSSFVPIEDVIHVYDLERAGQTRGVPSAASTIMKQRDLDDYEDAELLGKKAAACLPIFVTNSSPEPAGNGLDERIEKVEPGVINYLTPGETVTFATPPANNGFSEFTKTQHRGVANGYLITYEQLTGDLSNTNFSSARMGWLEFQRQVEYWQYLLIIPKLCDKVYKWFVEGLSVSESLNLDQISIRASWTAPRRQMIDPAKETNAKRTAMRSGLQSWEETVKQDGFNPDEVLAELTRDQKRFVDAGLMPDCTPYFEIMAQLKMVQEKANAALVKQQTTN